MHTRARQVCTAPCVLREPALHDVLSTFYGAVDSSVCRTRLLCKSVTPAADEKKHSSQGCSNGYIPGEVENCMQIFSYKSMRYHFRAVNSADIYVAIPMLMSLFRAPTPVQDWYMYHYNVVCTVCAMTNSAG